MKLFSFESIYKSKESGARLGVIHTPHGDIKTPAFVPVGTQATVKSLTPEEVKDLGTQLYFVNTYHMYLRPGIEIIKKMGGLHNFMHWDRPLITDSGGFQVFSLAKNSSPGRGADVADENLDPSSIRSRNNHESLHPVGSRSQVKPDNILSSLRANGSLVKISEDGVEFRSHWDGSKHIFTPESSMGWQWDLGADIHIAFDDCTPYPVTHEKAQASLERTHSWAVRSLKAHKALSSKFMVHGKTKKRTSMNDEQTTMNNYQALYGSVQGSVYEDLRKKSARFLAGMDFDGFAVGGVSVGESKKEMRDAMNWVVPLLPDDKPRHLLGVGEVDDIFALIEAGIDTFDCVQPTRLARMGWLLVPHELSPSFSLDITKAVHAGDMRPVDSSCTCYTCRTFTRAYIHHLFHVRELLGYRLSTIHNIHFMHTLVASIRDAIGRNEFLDLRRRWLYNR